MRVILRKPCDVAALLAAARAVMEQGPTGAGLADS
jgi:hypothetical protein